jgi:DNA-binding response OmpR family regulator
MAHILIIDDEADIRFILEKFLTNAGHTVDCAEDGKTGLRMTGLNNYDLVITDVVMPEMDGLEVITEIRSKYPEMRTIVMTGGTVKLDKALLMATANAMRAHKVVAKPLDLNVLKATVNEVLAS